MFVGCLVVVVVVVLDGSLVVSPRPAVLPLAAKPQLYVCETRYDAEEANELTILVGDRVKVLKKNLETGWYVNTFATFIGFFSCLCHGVNAN